MTNNIEKSVLNKLEKNFSIQLTQKYFEILFLA